MITQQQAIEDALGLLRVWRWGRLDPDAVERAIKKCEAALTAPLQTHKAEDAPSERTPQDYAIEHAEYMAVSGEFLITAINDFGKALQEVDDGTANPSDVDAARETLSEGISGLLSGIYEFRKRRDRAAIAQERKA